MDEVLPGTDDHDPVLDEPREEFGVELTPDAVGVMAPRLVEVALGFPQVKPTLNLPAGTGETGYFSQAETRGWDVGLTTACFTRPAYALDCPSN